MKSISIGALALLVSTSVHADAWFTKNEVGGEIIITDNVCYLKGETYSALKEGYARNSRGQVIQGCWYYDNGTVHMTYVDKTQYAYPVNIFSKMTAY